MKTLAGVAATVLTLALALVACAPSTTSERAGGYAGDPAITALVKTAMHEDPALRVMRIRVSTHQNVVQLSGSVDRSQMVGLAGRVASNVSGVASVQNDLVVN
jgi:osmotically-inducible protein OsmY